MPIKLVSLVGASLQAKSPNISAESRMNCYFDIGIAGGDKAPAAIYGTPGTTLVATPSALRTRGMYWHEAADELMVVQGLSVYGINSGGVVTLRATLPVPTDLTSDVYMADNGDQLMITTATNGYIYNWKTLVITDITVQLPSPGVTNVAFLDSYFIVSRVGTSQFYISDPYNGLVWNALNFASAEANPDKLIAVYASTGFLLLFGRLTIETWVNSGDPAFPFTRMQGAVSEFGLASLNTLSRANGLLTGLFRNRQGALGVYQIGQTSTPISTTELDYIIGGYAVTSDAVGFGYNLSGRPCYQITFPTEGATWLYDFTSGIWSRLETEGITHHIAHFGISFGKRTIVSTDNDGTLYELDERNLTDNGVPIVREVIFNHVFAQSLNNVILQRCRVDIEGGVGDLVTNPQISLTASRDGGHTWGAPMLTNMGLEGEYNSRAEWRRLGQSRNWALKLRMTDSVKFVVLGVELQYSEANK